jgi:hypothetical protein
MTGTGGFTPPPVDRLTGDERFSGTDASVTDFWRWAFSDLRTNALRGVLAEYLVALALDVSDGTRVEWDGHDVTSADGVRVEVKSSAYLQSWSQSRHSRIVFTGLAARTWSPELGYAAERTNNADVYVFAVHTCRDHAQYDMVDVDQWEFHVLPAKTVADLGTRSVGFATLLRHSNGPVAWCDLAEAVSQAALTEAETD